MVICQRRAVGPARASAAVLAQATSRGDQVERVREAAPAPASVRDREAGHWPDVVVSHQTGTFRISSTFPLAAFREQVGPQRDLLARALAWPAARWQAALPPSSCETVRALGFPILAGVRAPATSHQLCLPVQAVDYQTWVDRDSQAIGRETLADRDNPAIGRETSAAQDDPAIDRETLVALVNRVIGQATLADRDDPAIGRATSADRANLGGT
jgi:hypothetical protein